MNLVYGEIVEIFQEEGMRFGTVRCGGALKRAALDLLDECERGDTILMCDGVVIGKVRGDAETP